MEIGNKVLIKNSILFSIAPFIPRVVSVLLLPIMTKYLTEVDYGISGTISAYSQSIAAFSTLGMSVVVMNVFFKYPEQYKEIWKKLYGFLVCWMVIYAFCQAIILYFCIPEEAIDNRWWIILLTNFSTVFFGPTAVFGNAYFVYTKQSLPVVWRSVGAAIVTIFVNFALIVYLRMGYMGWYIGSFAGTFFMNASYWYVLNVKLKISPNFHFTWKEMKQHLNVSLPTIPHYYTAYLLEGSGRAVLDQYKIPRSEIGKVSMSQHIGDMFQTAITGLNNALSPYFMQYIKQRKIEQYRTIGLLFICFVFASAFLISLWSKELFSVLISNQTLSETYPYFILYIMALCYRPLYIVASGFYFYYEKTKHLLLISLLSGCIAMGIYVLFVPAFGVWAFLIGHYVACLFYGYSGYFYRVFKEHTTLKLPLLLIFVVQILLSITAFYCVEYLFVKIFFSVLSVGVIVVCIYKYLVKKK